MLRFAEADTFHSACNVARMPPSLLDSQVAALEPPQPDESGLVLDVSASPEALVSAAVNGLGLCPENAATAR